LPEIAQEDLAVALDAVAGETLTTAEVRGPPIDAVALARRLGLTVAWDDRQRGRARLVDLAGASRRESPSILLKHDPRMERVHWAVAHEIGEVLAERVFAALAVDPNLAPQQAREIVANGMASRLLLPGQWFGVDGNECE
jgi:Zn-dependent peptidase ImmA (M78 family)